MRRDIRAAGFPDAHHEAKRRTRNRCKIAHGGVDSEPRSAYALLHALVREAYALMLVETLIQAARQSPRKLAVDDGMRSLDYGRLAVFARVLRDIVRHETACPRIGIMLPASSAFPAALFGVLWASRIAVPLNFLLGANEIARIVADAELDLVLATHHFRQLCAKLPARVLYLEDLPLKRRAWLATLRRFPGVPPCEPHDTAVILYTSGTTAEPKGVELTYGNLHSNCVDSIASLQINPDVALLNILPPFHVFGLTANVLVPVPLRATVFALPRFSPSGVVKTMRSQHISVMLAIPSMYAALLRSRNAPDDCFRSLDLAISGGEPLPQRVREGFYERFGVAIREGYGLTETSPVVSVCTPDADRPGSVGRPIRNVEIRIAAPEGNDCLPDGDGEVLVRSPGVMKGYYKKPEATRGVIDADGWFHTGDLGHLDGDGSLTITGRVKDMLIIGGENVYPREIESVLESHDAVAQAAVIGVPDESRGEAPVAFVIPRAGASVSGAELRQHAKRCLAGYKVPKEVHIREDLPTGPTGKILKRRLHELC